MKNRKNLNNERLLAKKARRKRRKVKLQSMITAKTVKMVNAFNVAGARMAEYEKLMNSLSEGLKESQREVQELRAKYEPKPVDEKVADLPVGVPEK